MRVRVYGSVKDFFQFNIVNVCYHEIVKTLILFYIKLNCTCFKSKHF